MARRQSKTEPKLFKLTLIISQDYSKYTFTVYDFIVRIKRWGLTSKNRKIMNWQPDTFLTNSNSGTRWHKSLRNYNHYMKKCNLPISLTSVNISWKNGSINITTKINWIWLHLVIILSLWSRLLAICNKKHSGILGWGSCVAPSKWTKEPLNLSGTNLFSIPSRDNKPNIKRNGLEKI